MKTLTIGNVTLDNPFILAPMAGVSDLPFRLLCHEMGAGMACMEMISAKAILYKNRNTDSLLEIHPDEGPVSLQLFGSDPKILSEMAKQIEERPFAVLDLNVGCPVPKVVNNGEGSALMKDPKLVGDIVHAISHAIQKPFTVKIRKGFNDDSINAVEIAKIAEDNGAAAVAVHGRTREQFYSGEADWEIIARVKDAVSIPVIGNGDIVDAASARKMYEYTHCDGLMVGRACQGNPWVFRNLANSGWRLWGEENAPEATPSVSKPTIGEICEMIRRHAAMEVQYKSEYVGIREMRKHAAWYLSGVPHAAKLRNEVNFAESYEDLDRLLQTLEN